MCGLVHRSVMTLNGWQTWSIWIDWQTCDEMINIYVMKYMDWLADIWWNDWFISDGISGMSDRHMMECMGCFHYTSLPLVSNSAIVCFSYLSFSYWPALLEFEKQHRQTGFHDNVQLLTVSYWDIVIACTALSCKALHKQIGMDLCTISHLHHPPWQYQATGTLPRLPTQSHHRDTELTSPCPIPVLPSTRLRSDKYKFGKSSSWLWKCARSKPSAWWEACALTDSERYDGFSY